MPFGFGGGDQLPQRRLLFDVDVADRRHQFGFDLGRTHVGFDVGRDLLAPLQLIEFARTVGQLAQRFARHRRAEVWVGRPSAQNSSRWT